MRLFAPASYGWLIQHELRISWRYMAGRGRRGGIIFAFVMMAIAALAIAAGFGFASRLIHFPPVPPLMVIILDGVLLFMTFLMAAQTLSMTPLIFHDRGDLDLLLASPVRPWKILAVRMSVMAFNALLFYFILTLPLVLTSAVLGGHWGLLAAPLVLASLTLVATSFGVSVAMGLFRLLGPRRTRTVAQIFGVLVALSFLSIRFFIRSKSDLSFWAHLQVTMETAWWGPPAHWLARAATGEFLPLASFLIVGPAIFALTVSLLGARFAADASLAAGASEAGPRRASNRPTSGFKAGLMRNMIVKELKLLRRDPALISQALLQVLVLPITLFASMNAGRANAMMAHLWPYFASGTLAYMAGQLAAGLGWLTISGEEAPELLSCAPVTPDEVAKAKVSAVVLPVAVLLLVLSAALAWFSLWAGLVAFAGSCVGAAVMAYVELWMQRPGKRSEFRMRRRGSGSVWISLLEMLTSALVGVTTGLVAGRTIFAFIPGLLLVALVAVVASVNREKWLNRDA